jgi:hypothetical protein
MKCSKMEVHCARRTSNNAIALCALFMRVCLVSLSAKTMLAARQRNVHAKTLIKPAVISAMLNYKSSSAIFMNVRERMTFHLLLAFLFTKCVYVCGKSAEACAFSNISQWCSWCSCAYHLFFKAAAHLKRLLSSLFSLFLWCLLLGSLWALGSLF